MTPTTQQSGSTHPAWLVQTIEAQIIPRLLIQAVNSRLEAAPTPDRWHPTADDVADFSHLLVAHPPEVALAYLDMWQENGTALQKLYLDLLAPTSVHLARLRQDREIGLVPFMVARYRLLRLLQRLRRRHCTLDVASATPS